MTRSSLALFILIGGYLGAALVLIVAAFSLHILLGVVAFCLLAAAATRAVDSLLAEDRV